MLDFAALPPEINSGRMYAGAGAGPLMAAAAAWDAVAAEMGSAAAVYRSVLAELTGGPWLGASSRTMSAAAAPYVSWMNAAAAEAEQTAGQARAAVAAYEAAFAATVPPPEIEVNRALLAILVATNILGQNTPAIAATEAQYAEMWAQDAAAMYGYAGASATATALTPFAAPPHTTNPSGTATQAAAVTQTGASAAGQGVQSALSQVVTSVPGALQSMASGAFSFPDPVAWLNSILTSPVGLAVNSLGNPLGETLTMLSGFTFVSCAITPMMATLYPLALPAAAAADVSSVSPAAEGGLAAGSGATLAESYGAGGAEVSAGLGRATAVGELSVPPAWAAAAPEIRLASVDSAMPEAALGGVPAAEAAKPGFFGGIPPVGSVVNAPRGEQERIRSRAKQKVISTMPGEPEADKHVAGRPAQPQRSLAPVASSLTKEERDELERLRKGVADVAVECDAAARLLKEAML